MYSIDDLINDPTALNSLMSRPSSPIDLNSDAGEGPAGAEASTLGSSSPCRPSSPVSTPPSVLHTTSSVVPAKRRVTEMSEFASQEGRRQNLSREEQGEVTRIARLTLPEQNIWIAAKLVKHEQLLEKLTAQQAEVVLSGTLQGKIDYYSFTLITAPSLANYKTSPPPSKTLLAFLEQRPQWGLTSTIRNDVVKYKVVQVSVSKAFTDWRADMKLEIKASVNWKAPPEDRRKGAVDIFTLAQNILDLGAATVRIPLSVEFVGRVAILRDVYAKKYIDGDDDGDDKDEPDKDENPKKRRMEESKESKYWDYVDEKLATLRKKERHICSQIINGGIKLDRMKYGEGSVSMDTLAAAPDGLPDTN
ncbi:hypothetical protein EV122DRAFT_285302 [Schizophyllum commune]